MIKLKSILQGAGILSEQAVKQLGDTKNITFPSGKWKMTVDLQKQLDEIILSIQQLITQDGKVTSVTVEASESKVPNYDGETSNPQNNPLETGKLSELRINTILSYLNQSDIIKQNNIKVQALNKGAQGPEWVPGTSNKDDKVYTDVQYVRVAAFGEEKRATDFSQYIRTFSTATGYNYAPINSVLQRINNNTFGYLDASDKFLSVVPNSKALPPYDTSDRKIPINKQTLPSLMRAFNVKTAEDFIKQIQKKSQN